MRLSADEAALLDKRELELARLRGPWRAADLTRAIRRTRELRDKQRDLLQRQQLALGSSGRSKGGNAGAANSRTEAKIRLLERLLQEFEQQLVELEQESMQGPGRPLRSSSEPHRPARAPVVPRGPDTTTTPP